MVILHGIMASSKLCNTWLISITEAWSPPYSSFKVEYNRQEWYHFKMSIATVCDFIFHMAPLLQEVWCIRFLKTTVKKKMPLNASRTSDSISMSCLSNKRLISFTATVPLLPPSFYLSLLASRSDSSKHKMSFSRTGPLTLRMIERVVSSMNSTRTCVTPPREPVLPRTRVTLTSLIGCLVASILRDCVFGANSFDLY